MRTFFILLGFFAMTLGISACEGKGSSSPTAPSVATASQGKGTESGVPPGECVRWGCSSQYCGDPSEVSGAMSTCEWKEEYRCAQLMNCGRDADKRCVLTATPDSEKCFAEIKGAKPEL